MQPTLTPVEPDGFDLDPTLLPVTDTVTMAASTDDNCGSTCGACVTNA